MMFFFFNDTATTEIYTLSLHDALPIFTDLQETWTGNDGRFSVRAMGFNVSGTIAVEPARVALDADLPLAATPFKGRDRKSTRLNSSHANISYAVFCLKKKKKTAPNFYS